MRFAFLITAFSFSLSTVASGADVNCKASEHPFARGACAVVQCPKETWSRGSAKLITAGRVLVSQGLETDRVDFGVCGWTQFELQDAQGNTVAYGYTQERCIPAKSPGRARIEFFPPLEHSVPAEIAGQVAKVQVAAFCSGGKFTPFGVEISKEDVKDGIKLIAGKP